ALLLIPGGTPASVPPRRARKDDRAHRTTTESAPRRACGHDTIIGELRHAKGLPGMAKQDPTVGVIGLGFARSHIPAFQVNGCRVVAVCQRNRAHAQAIADTYGVEGV